MDRVFIRNFILFVIILLACAGTLGYSLIAGDRDLGKVDDLVIRTHDVISEAEQLSNLVEGMLAAQRGFLLTGKPEFIDEYEEKKAGISNHIALLSELISQDPSQSSRLDEIRQYFTNFSQKLEERALAVDPNPEYLELLDIQIINDLKNNIIRINSSILEEEYTLLNKQFHLLDDKKSEYFNTLLISVLIGTVLLLAFNGFLLNVQRKRSSAEASLKDTQERFALAIEGTQDGIFDWDITTDKIFYSRRFFEMLGHDRQAYIGHLDDLKEYVHPNDVDAITAHLNSYLNGDLSEYRCEFRMKHKSGRWIWVQSRAKALFDNDGKAYRMVGAHTDITYLRNEHDRLIAEKDQAQSANQAKSDFLAHMSHEIRTPLTAINGIAEIFGKMEGDFNDKQNKLIHTLLSSTASLKDLVDDILDFSKIESGELELDEQAFTIDPIFENVVSMMALRAAEKGISFVFDYSAFHQAEFYGDAKRIRQILINLVSNAIKFTDQGGVSVKADVENRDGHDFMRIDVADTGIGIAPEHFDIIFERFKQADSSMSRKYGGTGLGLPISLNLARLMGGDIFLSSEAGKGSTFTLLLPMRLSLPDMTQKKVVLTKKIKDTIRAQHHDKKRILLVEDYEGNIVVIGYILDDLGLAYDSAQTGVEAVDLWQKNHYDLILMDIQMPEMDGFTATKTIRSMEQDQSLPHTPIIGMTAHALVGDRDKCLQAGMDSYLPKPIIEADLKQEILSFIDKENAA